MAEKNTANIGFEKQIWDAACVLRGNMDASEYKNVVLGLIFLKYISDRFEEKYQELVSEGDGFEEDIDEYISEGIFFVPVGARWNDIAAKAHTPEIGTVIDDAMRAIEKENKRLKDILPKNFARPELDKRRLGEVVDLFTNIQMVEHGDEKDILGRTYEYCLSMFAEQEGKRGGEFFTPSCVVRTLVEVLHPYKGRVYDPCCGSGGMFVQSAKFVENHSGNISDISIYGQDSNPTTWKLAQMNLAIRGIEPDLGEYAADTFLNDRHPTMRADYILANPPFKGSLDYDIVSQDLLKVAKTKKTELLFLVLFLKMLKPGGRCACIVPDGVLFGSSKAHKAIRRELVEENCLEAVISMPSGVFKPYAGVSTAILIFTKTGHGGTDKVWFYDMKADGFSLDDKRNPINENDIPDIIKRFRNLDQETERKRTEQSFFVEKQDIVENEYDLSINKYKEVEYVPVEYPSTQEIMANLHELEMEITKNLAELDEMLEKDRGE